MNQSGERYIYLVDDDESFRASLVGVFTSLGYRVISFESANKFLAHQDILWPSILISDMRMPDQSGVELQKRLIDEGLGIPIIFISGESSLHEAVLGLKQGAIDFLQKPFNIEDLISIIEKNFEKQRESLAKKYKAIVRKEKLARLAPRELETCRLIVKGFGNSQIAEELQLSIETVKQYKKQINLKLGIRDLSDLIALMRDDD